MSVTPRLLRVRRWSVPSAQAAVPTPPEHVAVDATVDDVPDAVVFGVSGRGRFLPQLKEAWDEHRGVPVHLYLDEPDVMLSPYVRAHLRSIGMVLHVHATATPFDWSLRASAEDDDWRAQGTLVVPSS